MNNPYADLETVAETNRPSKAYNPVKRPRSMV